ncbi:MAG: DUF2577 family protein [Oscillospiraceae bacterium]|nr:DUF2577 family protein [Oscillospiraceae bacterium]
MDGYSRIYAAMRKAGGEGAQAGRLRLRLGTVRAVSPLSVEVAGTEQEAERFYICHRLARGHTEKIQLTGGTGSFSANGGTHGVSIDPGTVQINQLTATLEEPVLQAGDLVLLLTDDDQTFYLIDKVVQAT